MKISKTFRLSEEAVKILDSQDNATQFLEDLIKGSAEGNYLVNTITEERVIELIKQYAPKTEQPFVPKPPDPILGYPCCQMKRPCKHWIWDSGLQEYENSLTGEHRKDESVIEIDDL